MTFRIGQMVYVGWSGNVRPENRRFLCRTGTITGGPFPPLHDFGVRIVCGETTWVVDGDAAIAESLLFPFEDPGEAETRETGREVTA